MTRRHRSRGLTLVEVLIAIGIALLLLIAVIPVFVYDLVINNAFWEQRLAMRAIDAQLEQACYDAGQPASNPFTVLPTLLTLGPGQLPVELDTAGAPPSTVAWQYVYLPSAGATPTLIKVTTNIHWISKGHPMTRTGDVLISRVGLCKNV